MPFWATLLDCFTLIGRSHHIETIFGMLYAICRQRVCNNVELLYGLVWIIRARVHQCTNFGCTKRLHIKYTFRYLCVFLLRPFTKNSCQICPPESFMNHSSLQSVHDQERHDHYVVHMVFQPPFLPQTIILVRSSSKLRKKVASLSCSLTPSSLDQHNLERLTPEHILVGQPLLAVPPRSPASPDRSIISRWKLLDYSY
ncbi:Integrase catalytic domain-containing protein [Aphis craccivora]|uniref:Integrase catalytic domain-containing protein n=1 Tax=Aphis craccivora TaxID=307492 RepID=A0A6G0YJT0_APHCR|nr:Integrase catalytic domain-containing protein [Aphis craccivora]